MAELTIEQLRNDNAVRHIFLLVSKQLAQEGNCPSGCSLLEVGQLLSTETMLTIEANVTADYFLLLTKSPTTTRWRRARW